MRVGSRTSRTKSKKVLKASNIKITNTRYERHVSSCNHIL